MKKPKRKTARKVRGAFAAYIDPKDGAVTLNVPKLAKMLRNWGDIPKTLCDIKAQEISVLAESYLWVKERLEQERGK